MKKIIIIGGVAAGTSAAAKARRNDEDAQIIIYDKDQDVSYAGCGLPYYIGGLVKDRIQIAPRDAKYFKEKYNVDVYTGHEVLAIDPIKKSVQVRTMKSDEVFLQDYDKLVIATGASSVVPPIPGVDFSNVFSLRNVLDADRIKKFIDNNKPKSVAIIGTGFIGLEMAENLKSMGIAVTMVEKMSQVMPVLDMDMAVHLERYLAEKEVKVLLGASVVKISGRDLAEEVLLESGEKIATEFIIMAVGIRPNISIAKQAGIVLGVTGAIKTDQTMQTNLPDIYACGDCAESFSLLDGSPLYRPLGTTANKTGRIVGEQISGGDLNFRGILGTGIFKVFDMTVAQTGYTEKEAIKAGYEVVTAINTKPDKPLYYNGQDMVIKAVADKKDGRLLGVQIIGHTGTDKRIDVFATAMTYGAKAEDLFHLDLAYSPPYSTTKDPVMYTGMILENILKKGRALISAEDLEKRMAKKEKITIIDARAPEQYEAGHLPDAINIPQEKVRSALESLQNQNNNKNSNSEEPLQGEDLIVTYCNKGTTGNAVQNILLNKGYKKTYNLSGGFTHFKTQDKSIGSKEIKKKPDER